MLNACLEQIALENDILAKLTDVNNYVNEKFKGMEVDNLKALKLVLGVLADCHQHKLSELKLLYADLVTRPKEEKEN